MNRRARLAFVAMTVAETLLAGLLLLGLWMTSLAGDHHFADIMGRPITPLAPALTWIVALALGAALLWSAIWAFPAEAWPHGKGVRIGLLVSFLPVLALPGLEALEGRDSPIMGILSAAASMSLLALVAWVLGHPVALAGECWRRGRKVLCIGWACVALAPCLAAFLQPASLWVAGLVLLAVRLGLGVATPFAWGSSLRVRTVPQRRPTTVFGRRALACLIAMVVAETLLLSILSLGPWMESVESERTHARFARRAIPPSAFYDFAERFQFLAIGVAISLLWIAVAAFPKGAWPYGKGLRIGLLAGLLPTLAAMGVKAFVHVEHIGKSISFLGGAAAMISMLILLAWLLVHPLHLAREAKCRGEPVLSRAWTTVALATSLSIFPMFLTPALGITLVLSAGLSFLALRLGLGAATALAWRSSSSLGGAS